MPESIYEERVCKTHGNTQFVLEGRGYYRCVRCRSEQVSKRRRKMKSMLVAEFGGKCMLCGYDKFQGALQFHHYQGNKEFHVGGKRQTAAFSTLLAEAKKCVLLCANCHAEVEAGVSVIRTRETSMATYHFVGFPAGEFSMQVRQPDGTDITLPVGSGVEIKLLPGGGIERQSISSPATNGPQFGGDMFVLESDGKFHYQGM